MRTYPARDLSRYRQAHPLRFPGRVARVLPRDRGEGVAALLVVVLALVGAGLAGSIGLRP